MVYRERALNADPVGSGPAHDFIAFNPGDRLARCIIGCYESTGAQTPRTDILSYSGESSILGTEVYLKKLSQRLGTDKSVAGIVIFAFRSRYYIPEKL